MMKLNLQQFAAPGYTTPLRPDTFKNMQLNAGIMLKNFDYSGISSVSAMKTAISNAVSGSTSALGTIIGATRGGGSFTVTRDLRQPDVDGRRYGFKGDTFVDSVDAQLSTTLVEITPENLMMSFCTATSSTVTNMEVLKFGTSIDADDYLTNICWIGDLADGGYVLICLKNALNEADISLTWTDKGEGTLPVEFHAKQANVSDYDYAPFEVVFLTPST